MKVKFGQGISEMRGKLGGTVFSRNASGAYARNNVKPVNPRTQRQQAVRSRFAAVASTYRTITQGQRDSFELQKTNYPQRDRLGNTITLTGQQLFNKVNMQLRSLNLGRAVVTMPPPLEQMGTVNLNISYSDGNLTAIPLITTYSGGAINVNSAVPDNYALVLEATRALSSGYNNLKDSDYRQIGVYTTSKPVPENLTNAYSEVFGGLVIDSKVSFRAKLVYLPNAQTSPWVSETVVI